MNNKKRGRKPKNKIIVNDNPEFDNLNNNDIIIKINTEKNENSIDDMDNFYMNDNIDDTDTINNTDTTDNICKNCNKTNLSNNDFVPLKYINNIFYIKDKFCCEDCCEKYIFEKCNYNKYEIYSIYKLYKYNIKNNINIIIKYINTREKVNNNNVDKNIVLKLYRGKKENNILNFINNI